MKHYIPTVSKDMAHYPFLKKTLRKDYYRFKKIPNSICSSLTKKSRHLYMEILEKEDDRFWNFMPLSSKIGIICGSIGLILSILAIILRNLGL